MTTAHHHHHKHQGHGAYALVGGHSDGVVGAGGRSASQLWRRLPHRKFLSVSFLMLLLPFALVRLFSSGNSSAYSPDASQRLKDNFPPGSQEQGKNRPPILDVTKLINFSVGGCNIWKGDWIRDPSGPAYTNKTCSLIQEHQNCIKNGRPDDDYLYWRWKPNDCELPRFDAKQYLELVRGKAWAFAGDSIARNHFQSFLCSLAQVEVPLLIQTDALDRTVHWRFPSYNFILAVLWSPFLVNGTEDEAEGFAKGIEKLHLDIVDGSWASSLHEYDYIVLSSGQWYLKTSVYFVGNELVGCHYCPGLNLKEVGFYYAYRVALRTVFDYLVSSGYKGAVFFRTFTPDHFENGRWDNGGSCTRTVPFQSNAVTLEGMTSEMYHTQLEEYGKTLVHGHLPFKLNLADTIHASLLRPDAHPGPYRNFQPFAHDKNAKVQIDCLHWCLPGAIDTWSAMLLETLKYL